MKSTNKTFISGNNTRDYKYAAKPMQKSTDSMNESGLRKNASIENLKDMSVSKKLKTNYSTLSLHTLNKSPYTKSRSPNKTKNSSKKVLSTTNKPQTKSIMSFVKPNRSYIKGDSKSVKSISKNTSIDNIGKKTDERYVKVSESTKSNYSNQKEFSMSKKTIDRIPSEKKLADKRNTSATNLLSQTHVHASKRKKIESNAAAAKKMEQEIEKDTRNFSSLPLEKRWRIINYYFNEITFSDDTFANVIKVLHRIVDQVFRTYEGERHVNKYELEVSQHTKTKKQLKDLTQKHEESARKSSKLETDFDKIHEKYNKLYKDYDRKCNYIQQLVNKVNDLKKQNERIKELEDDVERLKSRNHSSSLKKHQERDEVSSLNSHMVNSGKKYKKNLRVPAIDLSKVEVEESDEEEDIDKMIEEAIEVELQQNPDIANQFDTMDDFKRYIFDKYFSDWQQDGNPEEEGEDLEQTGQTISKELDRSVEEVRVGQEEVSQQIDLDQQYYAEEEMENSHDYNSLKIALGKEEKGKENLGHEANGLGGKYGLNLKQMPRGKDYQDEFMANYENFSQSWRDSIQKNAKF